MNIGRIEQRYKFFITINIVIKNLYTIIDLCNGVININNFNRKQK